VLANGCARTACADQPVQGVKKCGAPVVVFVDPIPAFAYNEPVIRTLEFVAHQRLKTRAKIARDRLKIFPNARKKVEIFPK
jgi:hypothetical protein